MKLKVFDNFIPMRNEEGYADVDSVLEKLAEMLNAHNIPHSFTLPHNATIEEHPTVAVILCYCEENDLEVSLIYALFCKLYRGVENERVAKSVVKVGSRYLSDELTVTNAGA